jgi:hypothetical protein
MRSGNCGAYHAEIAQSGDIGLQVLTGISEFLAEHGIRSKVRKDNSMGKFSKLPIYRLGMNNRVNVIQFLTGVLPYIRIKKVKAQDMLRYAQLYPAFTNVERGLLGGDWYRSTHNATTNGKS